MGFSTRQLPHECTRHRLAPGSALFMICLCHHVKSFLTLSSGCRASLCLDEPLCVETQAVTDTEAASQSVARTLHRIPCTRVPSPCEVTSVGQIPSIGIAGSEGVSSFSFGGCSKAYLSSSPR